MSKEVSFPVMSLSITGILFFLGIILSALAILLTAVSTIVGAAIIGLVYFIGLLLLGWALLSYGLHPDIDESRRAIAFFFAVLLVTVLFGYGVMFTLSVG